MTDALSLLYLLPIPGFGGHARSAVTIASEFRDHGHQVLFAVCDEYADKAHVIEQEGFDILYFSRDRLGRFGGLRKCFPAWQRIHHFDATHAFDYRIIPELCAAARREHLKVFWTVCGGQHVDDPRFYYHIAPTIVFSQELKDKFTRIGHFANDEVIVEPARMKLGALRMPSMEKDAFRQCVQASDTDKLIIRVGRLSDENFRTIVDPLLAIDKLHSANIPVKFIHIGDRTTATDECIHRLDSTLASINERHASPIAYSLADECFTRNGGAFLEYADIVIGVGRSAFDGMIREKPCLIVGSRGFAGVVSPQEVQQQAYYNFAGRHVQSGNPVNVSIDAIVEAIERLLAEPQYYRDTAQFGRNYLETALNVRTAYATYLSLYRTARNSYPDFVLPELTMAITPWITRLKNKLFTTAGTKSNTMQSLTHDEKCYNE